MNGRFDSEQLVRLSAVRSGRSEILRDLKNIIFKRISDRKRRSSSEAKSPNYEFFPTFAGSSD
jgi:hypothetical protein